MKKVLSHILVFTLISLPVITLAQIGIKNPATSVDSIGDLVEAVIRIVRLVAIPFVVIAIIYSGWLFIAAQGSPDKLKNARGVFFWTLVGTLIVLSSELIASVLKNAFSGRN